MRILLLTLSLIVWGISGSNVHAQHSTRAIKSLIASGSLKGSYIGFIYSMKPNPTKQDTTIYFYELEWLEFNGRDTLLKIERFAVNQEWSVQSYKMLDYKIDREENSATLLWRKIAPHGTSRYFNPNGQILFERTTVAGSKQELLHIYEYYSDRKIKSESVFDNTVPNGEFKVFYPNGQLALSRVYKNGKLLSVPLWVSPTGEILPTGNLVNGNGKLQYYDKAGRFKGVEEYVNGEPTSGKEPCFDVIDGCDF